MENILTQEDIQFLKELASELKSQDNRCTASPYYYTILEKEKVYGVSDDYCDGYVLSDCSESSYETIEEVKEFLMDCLSNIEDYPDINGFEDRDEFKSFKSEVEAIEKWDDVQDILESEKLSYYLEGFELLGYVNVEKHSNVFLTEKAVEQHMKVNHYHYKDDTYNYVNHAWRNPEMEKLVEIIKKFV